MLSHQLLLMPITIRSNQRRVSDFLLAITVEEWVVWVIQCFGAGQYLTCHSEDTPWGILIYTSLPFPHTCLSVSALGMLSSLTAPASFASPWESHPQTNVTEQLWCAMQCSETRDKDEIFSLGKLEVHSKMLNEFSLWRKYAFKHHIRAHLLVEGVVGGVIPTEIFICHHKATTCCLHSEVT